MPALDLFKRRSHRTKVRKVKVHVAYGRTGTQQGVAHAGNTRDSVILQPSERRRTSFEDARQHPPVDEDLPPQHRPCPTPPPNRGHPSPHGPDPGLVLPALCIEGIIAVLQDPPLASQAAALLQFFEEHARPVLRNVATAGVAGPALTHPSAWWCGRWKRGGGVGASCNCRGWLQRHLPRPPPPKVAVQTPLPHGPLPRIHIIWANCSPVSGGDT